MNSDDDHHDHDEEDADDEEEDEDDDDDDDNDSADVWKCLRMPEWPAGLDEASHLAQDWRFQDRRAEICLGDMISCFDVATAV